MNKLFRIFAVAVVLFMMAAIIADKSEARWGWKKFQFQIVDEDGEALPLATARAMVNDAGIYHDTTKVWTEEDSLTTAYHAYLTVDSNGIVEFWGDQNSYNIRVTHDGRWDIFKGVGVTTHRLVFVGEHYQLNALGSTPESAPGMIMMDTHDRLYIGTGSFGNAKWQSLSG